MGLPRVEELFEAREPKGQAFVSEIDGQVFIHKENNKEYILRIEGSGVEKDEYNLGKSHSQIKSGTAVVQDEVLFLDENGKQIKAKAAGMVRVDGQKLVVVRESVDHVREYVIPTSFSLLVREGDLVVQGQQLTEGNLNLNQILALRGTEDAQNYIVKEVQDIYMSQGQNIHDKHIEVIVRQMFSKMRIAEAGESEFLVGDLVDKARLNDTNEKLSADNRKAATAEQLLMGITKVSLNTESFLAAASFQETTRVLIEAALSAKTDTLRGLKENVIIGKLIPAGTGFDKSAPADPFEGMLDGGGAVSFAGDEA